MTTQLKTQKFEFNNHLTSGSLAVILAPPYINYLANKNLKTCENYQTSVTKSMRQLVDTTANMSSKERSEILEIFYVKTKDAIHKFHVEQNTSCKSIVEALQ